jgi:hypothetical protein
MSIVRDFERAFNRQDVGEIRAYREYFDEGVALLQHGFKPEALAKVLARRVD